MKYIFGIKYKKIVQT